MRYFSNISWLFFEKVLRMFVGLFVGVWVARYLGPEQFGLFAFAQSFVGLFLAISTLGLDTVVIKELVKNSTRKGDIISTAFWLRVLGALLSLSILAVSVHIISIDNYTNQLVFIVAFSNIFQSFNVIDFYFQSKVMSKFIVYANVISLLISSLVKITLILFDAPLVAFAWAVLFDSFVLAIGFIYYFISKSDFKLNDLRFSKPIAINLLHDSWPFILSGTAVMIQSRIDQVMIKAFLGPTEVGHYSAAIRIIELVAFFPVILKASLYPSIENAKKKSNDIYKDRLLNFYRLNFLSFLIIAIPVFVFAQQIVTLLFGIEYQSAGVLLSLMSVRLFFANMGIARSVYILSENLMKFSLITMLLGTVVNVGFNYILIPVYGAKGAVLATIISFAVTVFIIDLIYSKTRENVLLQFKSIFTFFKISLGKEYGPN